VKEFKGRVAVITGGASGIGRGLADRFAREGMKIVIGDIEQAALDQAVAELARSGADCAGVRCDVSEYAEVERLANAAYDTFGAVHLLCNNAGVSSQAAPSWAQTEADWKWVLGVNLWGVIHGIRAFVPHMLAQKSEGHIVNTASLSGLLSMPYGAPYNVSKFGVVALTEALHFELAIAQSKLKTSVLCPAWVSTRILDSARNRPPELVNPRQPEIDEAWAQAFRARLAEGLTPETVAERVYEAVRDEQLYIWTHPEYKPAVRVRMEEVVEGRNPDIEKKLGGLGKEAKKSG
jgi:NAD(P)-dependent dehydrogenase (short-subunit alcohol dehydrogenase family)